MPDVEIVAKCRPRLPEVQLRVRARVSGLVGTEVAERCFRAREDFDQRSHAFAMRHLGLALRSGTGLRQHFGLLDSIVIHRMHEADEAILVEKRGSAVRRSSKLALRAAVLLIHR